VFPHGVQRKFENATVDYVVGGGISLRSAGGQRFKQLVVLTYGPPSNRTNWRRIVVELFRIVEPLILLFLRQLDVAISLTLDGWSNRTVGSVGQLIKIAMLRVKNALPFLGC
jgi:hypothetical protein